MNPDNTARFSLVKNFMDDDSLRMTINVDGKNISGDMILSWTRHPYILVEPEKKFDNSEERNAHEFIRVTLNHIVDKLIDKLEIGEIESNIYLPPRNPKMVQIIDYLYDFVFPFFSTNSVIRLRDIEHLLKVFDDLVDNEIDIKRGKFKYRRETIPSLKHMTSAVVKDIEGLNLENVPNDVIEYLAHDLMLNLKIPTISAVHSHTRTNKPFRTYLNPNWYRSIVVDIPEEEEDEFEEEEEEEEDWEEEDED